MKGYRVFSGVMVARNPDGDARGWRYRVWFPSGLGFPTRTRRAAFTAARMFLRGFSFETRLAAAKDADIFGGKLHKNSRFASCERKENAQ